jgi:hypothetical protein
MATRMERPRFFEGQYIGSADLEAVTAYARDMAREHALGGHSWGVATGLDLVESEAADGGVDYFVLPGFGWDGYGRPIVLLEPKQVPAAKFAGLPSGDQIVWLRYSEAPFQGLRPGFGTCGSDEGYSRIRESVEIEVGSFIPSQRESGIEVGGIAQPDARLAARLFDDAKPDDAANTAPVLCDGDVPHQAFPADSARWLVPIGVATWESGAPGKLKARIDGSLLQSRVQRRMAGVVGESLFAADGVIRLRDRYAAFQTGVPLDDLCAPAKTTDFEHALDSAGLATPRLVGKELVWVEGNMRVTGQARLFGSRLELRDTAGDETGGVPLYLRRRGTSNADGGQDLQIVVGETPAKENRLVVGPAIAPYGDQTERFVVRGDGSFAAGDSIPPSFVRNGLVASTADVAFSLAAPVGKISKLVFQTLTNPGPTAVLGVELAQVAYNDDPAKKALSVGASTVDANLTYWTTGGNVCLGSHDPQARLDIRQIGGTESLRIDAGAIQAIDAGVASRLDMQRAGGGVVFNASLSQPEQVAITGAGRLGLGTQYPSYPLHIYQPTPTLRVESSAGADARVELASGGVSSLAHISGNGSAALVNGGVTSMTWSGARVGIGLGGTLPVTNLHVRGSISGAASTDFAHVALIENLAAIDADVLALRVSGLADASNNFITFFDGTGAIGRIERADLLANNPAAPNPATAGSFLRLLSGGADFAECLPRREAAVPIGAGRIVGVRRGAVSLETAGADALMVTTDRAVVVGNAIHGAETSEMVAFVGQVYVAVDGPVASGDFILPSGRDDGTGRAVPPDRLAPADAAGVVGRAWSDSPGEEPGQVCVAVGVQGADALSALSAALVNQQRVIEALQAGLSGALPADGG